MIWHPRQFPELDCLEPDQRAAVLRRMPLWTVPILILQGAIRAFILTIMLLAGASALFIPRVGGFNFIAEVSDIVAGAFLVLFSAITTVLYLRQLKHIQVSMRAEIAKGFR